MTVTDTFLGRVATSGRALATRVVVEATAGDVVPPTSPPIYSDALVWAATTEENVSVERHAGEFMGYYMRLYPYVWNTGDLSAWKAHGNPDCGFCLAVAKGAKTDRAAGLINLNGPIEVTYTRVMGLTHDEFYVLQLVTEGPLLQRDSAGTVVAEAGRSRALVASRVSREGGTWRVLGISASTVQTLPDTGEVRAQDVPVSPGDPADPGVDGAASTAVQYALLHAHALATGDVEPIQGATDPACRGCAELIATAETFPASQRPGDGIVTVDAVWFWEIGGPHPYYGYQVGLVIDDGDSPPVSWIYNLNVRYENGRWYVESVGGDSYVGRLSRTDPVTVPPRDPHPDWVAV